MQRLDDDELRRWLREDAPHGDLSTRTLASGGLNATADAQIVGLLRAAGHAQALAYAEAGADFLVSSAPYFAPPADVRVTIAQG